MQKIRNGEIDVFRFIFAVIILIFHFNDMYNFKLFTHGSICVEFFFLVSGFLMAKQTQKYSESNLSLGDVADTTWALTFKKISPLYFYYFCALIFQIIIRFVIIQRIGIVKLIERLFRSIPTFTLSFMGLIHNDNVSFYLGNSWYLSALLIASLILYPIIIKSHKFAVKILFPLLSGFLLAFLICNSGKITEWKEWTCFGYEGIVRAVAEIALGASLFPLSELIKKKFDWLISSKKVITKVLLTIIRIFPYAVFIIYASGVTGYKDFTLHALLFCATGILFSFSDVGYYIKDSVVTRFLGKISLPIFLFHGFIRHSFGDYFTENQVTPKMFFLMILGTIITCVVLMFIIDFFQKVLISLCKKIKKIC